jgi:hypothetical protein
MESQPIAVDTPYARLLIAPPLLGPVRLGVAKAVDRAMLGLSIVGCCDR